MRHCPSLFTAISCIPIILILGCSQDNSPSQAEIKESFQKSIPAYSEITSLQIEKSENLGTETDPEIQSRFKASIRIDEDLYTKAMAGNGSFVDFKRGKDIDFLEKETDKGKSIEMYGLSTSKRFADTWKTRFKAETNPYKGLGSPRSEYGSNAIVKGSKEEKTYHQKVEKELAIYRKATISKLFNQANTGSVVGDYIDQPYVLRLTSDQNNLNNIEGTITFGKLVQRIQGKITDAKVSFSTTEVVSGKESDDWGLGTKYSFDLNIQIPDSGNITGTWERRNKSKGLTPLQIN